MANLMPEVPLELHVGDAKLLSHQFEKATRIDVQTISNYSAFVTFAYFNEALHLTRAGRVDGANGLAYYEMRGDELTKVGWVEFQFWVMAVDWYSGVAPGRFFSRVPSEIMKIHVLRRPA